MNTDAQGNLSDNHFGWWTKVKNLDLNGAINLVLTNHNLSNVRPAVTLLKYLGDAGKTMNILDFGSGVGRNAFALSEYSNNWDITCYDHPLMHEKAREFAEKKYQKEAGAFKNIRFVTNWGEVKHQKYDCIVASLVFQHIKEADLKVYLNDIKNMTRKLVVIGRRSLDEKDEGGNLKRVWKIMEQNGYFPAYCNDKKMYDDKDGNIRDHITCVYDIK